MIIELVLGNIIFVIRYVCFIVVFVDFVVELNLLLGLLFFD